jgi:dipeptidyl aminopeptidase/acylaminoacyl peptidase
VSRHRPLSCGPARSAVVAAALLALSGTLHPAGGQATSAPVDTTLTPELTLTLRRPTDLRFSPDGSRLAFVVDEPPSGATRARHIWMLDVASGTVRQFTSSAKGESSPRWSPDGSLLAFTSGRDNTNRLYLIAADGGEARALTKGKWSVGSFAWSPDGRQIAFLASDTTTAADEAKREKKDDARVVDRDDRHTRLWVVDAKTGAARAVTDARWDVGEFVWTKGGDGVVASATDRPESDEITSRIMAIALADGSMKQLAAPRGFFGGLRLSPDGATAYYVGCRVDGPQPQDLMALPLSGGPARNLTATSVDRPINGIAWRPDGSMVALVQVGFRNQLLALSGDRADSIPTQPSVTTFDLSSTGRLAFVGQSATEPAELYLTDQGGTPVRVTRFNRGWEKVVLGHVERFRYRSFDGLSIEGALLTPASYDGHSRLPLVTLVHGGPTGAWSDAIEAWGQLLATHGYAVFYPNPRGSTGYGQRFMEANRADWGGGDYKDVMAGVDALVARGVADPDRLGIGGWSYGGYMAEWAITQTHRFKAAVSGAGMANLMSEFGTENGSAYDEWFWGLPWEHPEGFLKSSPVTYLKNARTPTLILQGEQDTTDPLGQSQELYRGLKRYGVESDLVVYPREPHGLREELHLLDRLRRIVDWYERYLKPKA